MKEAESRIAILQAHLTRIYNDEVTARKAAESRCAELGAVERLNVEYRERIVATEARCAKAHRSLTALLDEFHNRIDIVNTDDDSMLDHVDHEALVLDLEAIRDALKVTP